MASIRRVSAKLAAVFISASALTAVFHLAPVHARTVDEPALSEALAMIMPAPVDERQPTLALPGMEAAPVQGPALIEVPDFRRARLSSAWAQGKRLGLKLAARDHHDPEYEVDAGEAKFYRVRTQSPEPGSMVAPGTRIVLSAAGDPGIASGY